MDDAAAPIRQKTTTRQIPTIRQLVKSQLAKNQLVKIQIVKVK